MLKRIFLGVILLTVVAHTVGAAKDSKSNPAVLIFKNKNGEKITYYRSDVLQYKQTLPEEIRLLPSY